MNRTIKFRGQRDNGEFVVGHYCVFPDGTHRIAVTSETGMAWYTVKPETVGQYIGIPDTAGRDIYEGMAIEMVGDYWDVAHQYKVNVSGIVAWSGTSWGVWMDGVFHGIDNTPWEEINLINQ